jgi:hypothetical protein
MYYTILKDRYRNKPVVSVCQPDDEKSSELHVMTYRQLDEARDTARQIRRTMDTWIHESQSPLYQQLKRHQDRVPHRI